MKRTVFLRAAALMLGLAFCLVSGCNVLAPKQSNIKAENCNGSGIDIDIKPVEFLKLGDQFRAFPFALLFKGFDLRVQRFKRVNAVFDHAIRHFHDLLCHIRFL